MEKDPGILRKVYLDIPRYCKKTTMTNRTLYYAAAATTAIAGILHLSLVPDIIGRNLNSGVFFPHFWNRPNILGHTHAKAMGKNLVLYWNSRYHNIDNNVGNDKSTWKSYYR